MPLPKEPVAEVGREDLGEVVQRVAPGEEAGEQEEEVHGGVQTREEGAGGPGSQNPTQSGVLPLFPYSSFIRRQPMKLE